MSAHPVRPPSPRLHQVTAIYRQPLLDLVFRAATVHRRHHDPGRIQRSTLLSIKTGACPEDCAYCAQSARYRTDCAPQSLLSVSAVVAAARRARAEGGDRFCLAAAWRAPGNGRDFDVVLEMIREVKKLGLETCASLGLLSAAQAARLQAAGLDYYNHNLDSSPAFYEHIVTTRRYEDRLRTLEHARRAGLKLCCGGILGMGESEADRIELLHELARQDPPPESVPVNALVPVPGTPLAEAPPLPWDQILRFVAACRILLPRSWIRLSAGRRALGPETQTLCFLAGANSIFSGERLLTTRNASLGDDRRLLATLGLTGLASGAGQEEGGPEQ